MNSMQRGYFDAEVTNLKVVALDPMVSRGVIGGEKSPHNPKSGLCGTCRSARSQAIELDPKRQWKPKPQDKPCEAPKDKLDKDKKGE